MLILDISEACPSRVQACLSGVRACLSGVRAYLCRVRACLSGVRACLSRVRACVSRVRLKFKTLKPLYFWTFLAFENKLCSSYIFCTRICKKKLVRIVFKMSILDLSEACLSRVWACRSGVRARLSGVWACLSSVWACLSGVRACLMLIPLLFLSFERREKKIIVTATYSASESAKNVLKWTLPIIKLH